MSKANLLPFDREAAVAHVRASDAKLAAVIDAVGPLGLALDAFPDPFGGLAEAIVYQQLTGKAAATIFGRVASRFGDGKRVEPRAIVAATDESLREVGLSRAKAAALRDLSSRHLAGSIPSRAALETMDDDTIVEHLSAVRGVGRWTVEMLLIFRMGRPDVLPVADYGIRKGFAKVYRKRALPDSKTLEKHGRRWRPFRTVASWYLWRSLELP